MDRTGRVSGVFSQLRRAQSHAGVTKTSALLAPTALGGRTTRILRNRNARRWMVVLRPTVTRDPLD
jgi:hypothetical protein